MASMSLRYLKIKKKPRTFLRLFGVSVSEFETILSKVLPEWEKKILGCYKGPGRRYDHSLEDMVLMLLLYYRSYIVKNLLGICLPLINRECAESSKNLSQFWLRLWPFPRANIYLRKRLRL